MSVLKTELKKEERARDVEAMERATFFLSSIDDSALVDQVHRECALDGGGTKSRLTRLQSGPESRTRRRRQALTRGQRLAFPPSRAQTRR
jgi:hypothetical protein